MAEKQLYNVIYSTSELETFFNNRFKLGFVPYIKQDNKFIKLNVPGKEVKFNDWASTYNNGDIYKFNSDSPFTLVIFDSRDIDSVLTKDIIVKQYEDIYGRNVTDWKEDGIIIYDTYTQESLYETIDDTKFFDPYCLYYGNVDEVFVCGYCIQNELLSRFSNCNEKLFIFENNPYKINDIKSNLKYISNTKYCMSKSHIKSYQAFLLFRDPISNIKPKDNKGLAILKDYSDFICNNFSTIEEWENLEKVKQYYEKNIGNNDWRSKLVEVLFNNKSTALDTAQSDISKEKINVNVSFKNDLINKPLKWAGNVIALNTVNQPTLNQIKTLVTDKKEYSTIITFHKDNDSFWEVNIYKTLRNLGIASTIDSAKSLDDNGDYITWYTEAGLPVIKVEEIVNNDIVGVKWYNISGRKRIPVNNYIANNSGNYVFSIDDESYIEIDTDKSTTTKAISISGKTIKNPLKAENGTLRKYIFLSDSSNVKFDIVYPTNEVINFNNTTINSLISTKYYSQSNKYCGTAYLTDKQMYDCIKTKTL